MAENVSRQTGHCRAGDSGALGWLGWMRLLLCEAVGETGGESVRSMNSSSGLAGVASSSSIWMAGPLSLNKRAQTQSSVDGILVSGQIFLRVLG